jgi:hypothetical protein
MSTETANRELFELAEALRREQGIDWAEATLLAGEQRPDLVEAGRPQEVGATLAPEPVVSLSVKAGETFDDVVERVRGERALGYREATLEVSRLRPDLAAAR